MKRTDFSEKQRKRPPTNYKRASIVYPEKEKKIAERAKLKCQSEEPVYH
jgi:hypothetical protein